METRMGRGKVGLSPRRMIWISRVFYMVDSMVTAPVDYFV